DPKSKCAFELETNASNTGSATPDWSSLRISWAAGESRGTTGEGAGDSAGPKSATSPAFVRAGLFVTVLSCTGPGVPLSNTSAVPGWISSAGASALNALEPCETIHKTPAA